MCPNEPVPLELMLLLAVMGWPKEVGPVTWICWLPVPMWRTESPISEARTTWPPANSNLLPKIVPLAVMCWTWAISSINKSPLPLISPVTIIPSLVVSNFLTLSCLNSVPAPSVNVAIESPSESSLILITLPCKNKSPVPLYFITLLFPSWNICKSPELPKFILTLSGKFTLPVIFIEPVNVWTSFIELPKVLLPSAVDIMFVTNSLAVTLPPTVISPPMFKSDADKNPLALIFPPTLNNGSFDSLPLIIIEPVTTIFWNEVTISFCVVVVTLFSCAALIVSTVKLFRFVILNVVFSDAFIS